MKNLIEDLISKSEIDTFKELSTFTEQYNLITAPKQIKLSEIVSRLEEVMLGCDSGVHIERYGKHILIYEKTLRSLTPCLEINLNNNKIKGANPIVSIREECFLSSLKWLYTLWIAGTEIIDDLECDKDE